MFHGVTFVATVVVVPVHMPARRSMWQSLSRDGYQLPNCELLTAAAEVITSWCETLVAIWYLATHTIRCVVHHLFQISRPKQLPVIRSLPLNHMLWIALLWNLPQRYATVQCVGAIYVRVHFPRDTYQGNRVSATCLSVTATYLLYLRVLSSICMFPATAMYAWVYCVARRSEDVV